MKESQKAMALDRKYSIKGILKGIGYFVVYTVLMMLFQTLLSVVFIAIKAAQGVRDESLLTSFATDNMLGNILISNFLIGLTFFLIYKIKNIPIAKAWKLNPFTWKAAATASVCTLAYTILFILVKDSLGVSEPDVITESANYYSTVFPGFDLLMMCLNLLVVAPTVEEIVLRGVVYNQIEGTTNNHTAIFVSALLFGLIHIAAGGATLAIGAFLIGLVFAYVYARTKSLWVCIIAHSIANLPDIYLYLTAIE